MQLNNQKRESFIDRITLNRIAGKKFEDILCYEIVPRDYASTMNSEKIKILKVLIIDDELDICYLLSGILRQKKLRTSYVNTLSEAEVALRTDPPALLFLDNHLPDGFGLDFIHHIKHNYPAVKIIMITAHDSAAERNRAYTEGVDFFISKPFTRELINSTVDLVLA